MQRNKLPVRKLYGSSFNEVFRNKINQAERIKLVIDVQGVHKVLIQFVI